MDKPTLTRQVKDDNGLVIGRTWTDRALAKYGSTTFGKLLEMIHSFSDNVSPFDQLIIYPTFIHVSFCSRNRRQIIDKRN